MPSPDHRTLTTRRDALFLAYESALQRLGIFTGFVQARSLAEINPEERARMNYAREQLNELRFERVNLQRAELGLPQLERPKPFPTAEEEAIAASAKKNYLAEDVEALDAAASKPSLTTASSNGADNEHVTIAAEDSVGDGA